MKRNKNGLTVVLIMAVLVSGCGGNTHQEIDGMAAEPTSASTDKIINLDFVYPAGDSTGNQVTSQVVAEFNRAHPNIRIIVKPSVGGYSSYDEYLNTKIAVDEFPDVLEVRNAQIYADAGLIAPLPEEIVRLIDEPALVNDHAYTAPLVKLMPNGIIYNKDIFVKAGITEEPKTWDEFLSICQKIKDMGINPIVVGGRDLWHMNFWSNFFFGNYMYADNQNWNADRSAGKVSFTDPNVIQAMKDMIVLWDKGYVDKGWLSTADNQTTSFLISGKAAMLYSGPWMFNTIKEADPGFNIGFFAPPGRDGRVVTLGKTKPMGYALSAEAAKDPGKSAAFVEFMKFFYSKEQYTHFLKLNNAVSVTKEDIVYEAPEATQKLISIADNPNMVKVLEMNSYWGENQMPARFRDWFLKVLQEVISTGKPTIEEALKQADAEWDRGSKK